MVAELTRPRGTVLPGTPSASGVARRITWQRCAGPSKPLLLLMLTAGAAAFQPMTIGARRGGWSRPITGRRTDNGLEHLEGLLSDAEDDHPPDTVY